MEQIEQQRLARLETVIEAISEKQDTIISNLNEYSTNFNLHLQQTAVFQDRLHRTELGLAKHSEELYGSGQLVYTVRRLAEKDKVTEKIIWEVSKPVLGLIGVGIIILVGIFGMMFYSMQQIIQALAAIK